MLTQSKEHATVFNEGDDVLAGKPTNGESEWEAVRYRKRVFNDKKIVYKAKINQTK